MLYDDPEVVEALSLVYTWFLVAAAIITPDTYAPLQPATAKCAPFVRHPKALTVTGCGSDRCSSSSLRRLKPRAETGSRTEEHTDPTSIVGEGLKVLSVLSAVSNPRHQVILIRNSLGSGSQQAATQDAIYMLAPPIKRLSMSLHLPPPSPAGRSSGTPWDIPCPITQHRCPRKTCAVRPCHGLAALSGKCSTSRSRQHRRQSVDCSKALRRTERGRKGRRHVGCSYIEIRLSLGRTYTSRPSCPL